MKLFFLSFFCLLILNSEGYSQQFEKKILARIGNVTIDQQEFLQRYEMNPDFNRQRKKTVESSKIEFLFTLIAEKLWALDAIDKKLDTTEVMRFTRTAFEKLFVRDALFQKEIKGKIIITEKELNDAFIKYSQKLYVNFLFSDDKEEINFLYKLLSDGVPFDSILVQSPEADEQKSPVEVVFGQMEESVENALFQLKTGEYTKPLLTPDGYYIFKLVNKSNQTFPTNQSEQDARKNVSKIIEARKLIERQKEFYTDFFRNKKVDINPQLFEFLCQKISALFEDKKKRMDIKDNELINLDANDVLSIENEAGDQRLKMNFILFDQLPINFKTYLRSLVFDGFNSKEFRINYIRALLDDRVKKDIEKELLYREGLKRGYNLLPEVRKEIDIWQNNYLFQAIKNKFLDSISVSDEEVYNFYKENNKPGWSPMLVNIIEVFTDSLELTEKIFEMLNAGADIKDVAALYNKRKWTIPTKGEYGLFPVMEHGEIGRIASSMNVGDIYGPLSVDNGYSIFKLIDKQDAKTLPPQPFEKFKDQYKKQLAFQKIKEKADEFTYQLSVKYDVKLDLDELEKTKVTTFPSFAIRHLGFGGKITAVPILAPNVDWADKWIKYQQPKVNP